MISNIGVGHDFPAGTSDINEVWVQEAEYAAGEWRRAHAPQRFLE